MYIFGGIISITHETNDFCSFDFKTEKWEIIHAQQEVEDPITRNSPLTALKENKLMQEMNRNRKKLQESNSPHKSGKTGDFSISFFKMLQNNATVDASPLLRKKMRKGGSVPKSEGASFNISLNKSSFVGAKGKPRTKSPQAKMLISTDLGEGSRFEVNSPTTQQMKCSVLLRGMGVEKRGKAMVNKSLYEGAIQPTKGKIVGQIPCARDGHAIQLLKDKIYIFGGDRNQMAFNDLYCYSVSNHPSSSS